ncbi:MAG: FAD-binding oxidoreductase, partial [Candidatus Saccharimonadales bacterium]
KKHGRNISVTGRSAGTDMTGGALSESIILSFTRYMNRLLELGDDYAVVEPGMYYRDFEVETLKKNLILPSYPASRELCAMGGIVANNSGGEKTLKYGKTERYLDTIWMVCEDGQERPFSQISRADLQQKITRQDFEGNIYRQMYQLITENYEQITKAKPDVTKNSAGYYLWNVYDRQADTFNLAKLITGSQGTLGIITKAKLKLVRPQKYSKLLIIFLKDMSLVSEISQTVLPLNPESFETYDDNTFKLAIKFFPELLRQIKAGFFKLMLKTWPELLMLAEGGIPKLVLLAEFTADNPRTAAAQAEKAKKLLSEKLGKQVRLRVTRSKEETEEFWTIRRDSFNLLRKHMRG